MGNAPTIVASRANLRIESQGKHKKLIVTDTAAGQLQIKQHTVIKEHTDQVNCVAMSPTGILASSGNDGEMVLYDTKTQKPLALREDAANLVYALCFSPTDGGRHLVSASFDKTVRLFNIAAFTHPDEHVGDTQKSKRLCTLFGHRKAIGCVSYSRDAKYLATGSDDETIIVWNMTTIMKTRERDIVHQIPHPGPVYAVAFSSASDIVFSCCKDRGIRAFACESGHPAFAAPLFGRDGHAPITLSASPDGTMLASGSLDKTIIIWDLTVTPPVPKFEPLVGHTGAVRSVAFSENSSFLVSGSEDATIRVWKILNGLDNDNGTPSVSMAASFLAGTERVNSVCWSPDNNFVVSGSFDSTVRVFTFSVPDVVVNTIDVKTPNPETAIAKFEFSPDGEIIYARDHKNNIIEQWFTTPRSEHRIAVKEAVKKKKQAAEAEQRAREYEKKLEQQQQQQQHEEEENIDEDALADNWAQQIEEENEEQEQERLREEEERIREEQEVAMGNKRYFRAAGLRGQGFLGVDEVDDGSLRQGESSAENSPTRAEMVAKKQKAAACVVDDEEGDDFL